MSDATRPGRLTRARRDLIDRLVDQLLDADAETRDRSLAEMNQRAPRVASWVARLLAASREPTRFLQTLFERAGNAIADDAHPAEVQLPPGTRLGAWRLIEPIGAGGMGTVYRAERADGAFVMQAAVKLIRLNRPGLNQRLESERRLLARLDHRHIARLLDGGASDEGLAYLVMEWVSGEDLDRFVQRVDPALSVRLDLFEQIAEAVAHAHQRQVVHGDLKPANVRVTDRDKARLLDFGVARLVEKEDSAVDDPGRALTPAYSAPEQLNGEAATTLSDVWALGTLLRWLLGATASGDAPAASGADRLPREIPRRADLEAILARARAHAPEARYESVVQFLDDVRRYRTCRAIQARGPTGRHVAVRFIQRHRLLATAGMAAMLAIGLGLAGALWQAHVAGTERDRAQLEAAKSREVSDFLVGLFDHADPGTALGKEITARQMLETGIAQVERLHAQPLVQAGMYQVLARVEMNLGDYDSAQRLAGSALAIYESDLGNQGPELAATRVRLGDIDLQQGQSEQAASQYQRAIALLENVESTLGVRALNGLGGARVQAGDRLAEGIATLERAFDIVQRIEPKSPLAASVANNLGAAAYYDGRYDDAIEQFQNGSTWLADHFGADHPQVLFGRTNLAWLLTEQARYAEAEEMLIDLLDAQERVLGPHHPHRAANLHSMGSLLWRQGKTDQAIEWWERALDARISAFGAKHPDVAGTQNALALALASQGKLLRAESLYETALTTLRDPEVATTIRVPAILSNLADLRIAQHRYEEAMRLHQEALELRVELLGNQHHQIGMSQRKIAQLHLRTEARARARTWAESSLATLTAAFGDSSHPEIAKTEALLEQIDAAMPVID